MLAEGSEHPLIVSARRAADGKIRADFEAARDSQAPGALAHSGPSMSRAMRTIR